MTKITDPNEILEACKIIEDQFDTYRGAFGQSIDKVAACTAQTHDKDPGW